MLRAALAVFGILWGVQFVVFRDWWTSFLTADELKSGFPPSLATYLPYVFAAVSFMWAILAATGFFGAI